MKITRTELKKIIKEVISELELFEGLTKAQEKLPEPLKKAILKKQGESDSTEEKEDVEEGLTKAQEKLPEPLKKAILKKQGKTEESDEEEKIEEGNAFGAAVKVSARENGEKEFEVGGKKYKLKEKKEITEQEDTEEFVGEDEELEESSCSKHEDDEEDVEEGNAFGAISVTKAKEDGEDEFEVDGKTYKVKESTDEVNQIEIGGKKYKANEDWSKLTLSERLNRILGDRKVL